MNNEFEFMLYKVNNEDISVNALVKEETIWLTQKSMAELFGVEVPAISKHLTNIYDEGELVQDSTVSKMETVQTADKVHSFFLNRLCRRTQKVAVLMKQKSSTSVKHSLCSHEAQATLV